MFNASSFLNGFHSEHAGVCNILFLGEGKNLPCNKYIALYLSFSYHIRTYKSLNIHNFHGVLLLILFVSVYSILYTNELFFKVTWAGSERFREETTHFSDSQFFQNVLFLVKILEFCACIQQQRFFLNHILHFFHLFWVLKIQQAFPDQSTAGIALKGLNRF